jgi:hypothetical protein
MPGFGMDPMSQSMYGGFGNMGMNMNNGLNGMNFNAGQGMYGGWNGQPNMWNGGQVNNNPNAFPNSMGNFGSNSGYGYNMSQHSGNFSQMPHQQQFPNHDYQQGYNRPYGRGRGRGRGYDNYGNRGRGGYSQQQQQYNQGYQGNHPAQQNQPQQQWQQQNGARQQSTPNRSTSPTETVIITDTIVAPSTHTAQTEEEDQALQSIEDQPQQDEDQSPQGEDQQTVKNEPDQTVSSPVKDAPAPEQVKEENTAEKPDVTSEENHIQPVRSVLDDDIAQNETPPLQTESMPYTEDPTQSATSIMAPPTAPAGPAAHFQGDTYDTNVRGRGSARASYRGGVRGRGSFSNGGVFTSPPRTSVSDFPISAAVEPKGLGVAGAPTGPKAMREGFAGAGRGANIRGSATAPSIPTGPKIPEQDRRYDTPLQFCSTSLTWYTVNLGIDIGIVTSQDLGLDLEHAPPHGITRVDTAIVAIAQQVCRTRNWRGRRDVNGSTGDLVEMMILSRTSKKSITKPPAPQHQNPPESPTETNRRKIVGAATSTDLLIDRTDIAAVVVSVGETKPR